MHLELSLSEQADGTEVALSFETFDVRLKCTLLVDRDVPDAITSLLFWAYTRKADRYVATCMELTNLQVNDTVSNAINQMALVVIDLDTKGLDQQAANAMVHAKTPAMLHLVGRSTWSGYPARRKEFDELTALAELINERVKHPEHNSCSVCMYPMPTTTCARCAKAEAA